MAATLKISVNGIESIQRRLSKLVARVEDTTALAKVTGEVMQGSIERTFDEEGSPRGSWRRLHASTLGVQFAKGGKKVFRKDGRNTAGFLAFAKGKQILTGPEARLRRSITYTPTSIVAGVAQVLIGSNLAYSAIHQFGGVIKAKTSKGLRFPISTPTGLQWITRKSVSIPARPYLVFRPEDPQRLKEAVEKLLLKD